MSSLRNSCLLVCVLFALLCGFCIGDEEPVQVLADPLEIMIAQSEGMQGSSDFEGYNILIYDCGTDGFIIDAMPILGIDNYTVRNAGDSVTANDLASHDILIVSWNDGGDSSGLDPDILYAGITGNVILTGHDSDFHTVNGPVHSKTLFSQMIDYILNSSSGMGMIGLTDPSTTFSWLPDEWGITATSSRGENIETFTPEGLYSGIYDGLTPENMSNWENSYHTTFTEWGSDFVQFELGGASGDEAITIAGTTGTLDVHLYKDDGLDPNECVTPEDIFTYTITVTPGEEDEPNAILVDYLPWEVDFIRADPNTGDYSILDHTYTWEIGGLTGIDPNSGLDPNDFNMTFEITVMTNYSAEPMAKLVNIAEVQSGEKIRRYFEFTPVCCWSGDIIYVDKDSTGSAQIGTSWSNAFWDIQDALAKAFLDCGSEIWVANGTYKPGNFPISSFVIPDGIKVYGGFGGDGVNETSIDQRNFKKYETILTGLIDEDPIPDVDTIVTMGDDTLLDGFTVTKSLDYAVYGNGVDFTVENCVVEENYGYGVRATDGNVIIKWCQISSNINDGIRHTGIGFGLTVENSWILRNGEYGIYCLNSTPTIKNSIISESDLAEEGRQGIRMINPTYSPVLHNNTIANNKAEGISFVDNGTVSDPNEKDWPDMQNCIVYYNNPGGSQLTGFSANDFAYYSCIQDCNEVNDNHNYNDKPGFAYTVDPNGAPDPENYHLAYDAFCKDKANPSLTYTGQVDMDGEGIDRKYGDYVDIGADEVYSCDDELSEDDFYNELDLNADGIVNLWEFNLLSAAWETYEPNHPSFDPNTHGGLPYDARCDFDSDWYVGVSDLGLLAEDWLWIACWKLEELTEAMAMSGGESMMMAPIPMQPATMPLEPEPEVPVEPQPEVSPDTLVQIIDFLDEALLDQPENVENIEDLRAILIDELQTILEE